MIRNYFLIAWRKLRKERLSTIINISGLSLGLAVSLLIGLFVLHERSYDRFHSKIDQIYRIHTRMHYSGFELNSDKASPNIGPDIKRKLPGVIEFVRFFYDPESYFETNSRIKLTSNNFALTDAAFFEVFDFKLLSGNPKTVFQNPQSVVITERISSKFFGSENSVGKLLLYKGKIPFVVSGIMANPPPNSTIQLDVLAPITAYPVIDRLRFSLSKRDDGITALNLKGYSRGKFETYFLVQDAYTANKIPNLLREMTIESGENGEEIDLYTFYIQPLQDVHFGANFGDQSNVRLTSTFGLAAILILSLALFNYMSLTTAQSVKRGREVAIRKAAGASRISLICQFYFESTLLALISFALAIGLLLVSIKSFENFIQISIDYSFINRSSLFLLIFGVLFFTIIVSGSYPALLLSAFSPAEALRGRLSLDSSGSSGIVRKILTVIQFGVCVGLMSCSLTIYLQLQLLRTKDIGLQKTQVLAIPFPASMSLKVNTVKKQLSEIQGIDDITVADLSLFRNKPITNSFVLPNNGNELTMSIINAEVNFIEFFGIKWVMEPLADNRLGSQNTMILNEKAANVAGIYDQGKTWSIYGQSVDILGITKNFNITSLRDPIEPVVLFLNRDSTHSNYMLRGGCFYLKLSRNSNSQNVIKIVNNLYRDNTTDAIFSYYFLDEAFDNYHKSERKLSSLFGIFTGISLFIACIGLFGLVTFMTENRAKEVGIRKLLGASEIEIIKLLYKDFIVLVVIALVMALPIAWFVIEDWLQGFAYRVDAEYWVFGLTIFVSLFVAMMTIGYKIVKLSFINSADVLKKT